MDLSQVGDLEQIDEFDPLPAGVAVNDLGEIGHTGYLRSIQHVNGERSGYDEPTRKLGRQLVDAERTLLDCLTVAYPGQAVILATYLGSGNKPSKYKVISAR